jgi:hypothetical protein
MGLDDLHIDRLPGEIPPPREEPPSGSPVRWAAVAVAGIVLAGLLTFWWMNRAKPGTATPAPTSATEVAVESKRPKRQPINLPALDASDSLLRGLVSALSQHPTLARLVATPKLVRSATVAIVQIGDGRTPAESLNAIRPSAHVQILGASSGRVAAGSYGRWDGAVGALTSVRPADAAQLYVNVKPLFDQAYIELGHPGGDFDAAIVNAIQMLADTPTLDADPVLIRRSNFYEHEDPALRKLPAVQKQFLLTGAEHRKRLLAWMREFAAILDLDLN